MGEKKRFSDKTHDKTKSEQAAEKAGNLGSILRQAQDEASTGSDEVACFQRLSPHGELVAVRRAHREAMGNIVLSPSKRMRSSVIKQTQR
jgi:hypothetical protein